MPNWVSNKLTIKANNVKEVLEFIESKHGDEPSVFDFNNVIPMPKALNCVSSVGDLSDKQRINMRIYGYKDWYDWRIAKWGTKWNASDAVVRDNTVKFDTAWNVAWPVFFRLSELFPEVEFGLHCSEEADYFNFDATIRNGQVIYMYDNQKEHKYSEKELEEANEALKSNN